MLIKTKKGNNIEEYSEVFDSIASSDLLDNYNKLSKRAAELTDCKDFLEVDLAKNITLVSVKFDGKIYGELIIQYEEINEDITIRLRIKNVGDDELYLKTSCSPDSVISFDPVSVTNSFDVEQKYGNRYIVDYLLDKLLGKTLSYISK